MAFHWGTNYVDHWPQNIKDDLPMAQNDPFSKMTHEEEHLLPIVNIKTGELLVRFPGPSTRRVSRTKMRLLLSRGIDIQYGKRFVNLDDHGDGVTAFFDDGTSAQGSILVGCDSGT